MKIMAILFMLLAQNNFPIPTPQPLPSPTAYPTSATAAPDATSDYPLQEIEYSLATVEAELSAPIQVSVPTELEMLVDAFGLIRYVANHSENLFGVFAPIFQFLLFLTPIVLILGITYAGNLLVTTIYSIVSDIFQKIRG